MLRGNRAVILQGAKDSAIAYRVCLLVFVLVFLFSTPMFAVLCCALVISGDKIGWYCR